MICYYSLSVFGQINPKGSLSKIFSRGNVPSSFNQCIFFKKKNNIMAIIKQIKTSSSLSQVGRIRGAKTFPLRNQSLTRESLKDQFRFPSDRNTRWRLLFFYTGTLFVFFMVEMDRWEALAERLPRAVPTQVHASSRRSATKLKPNSDFVFF